MTMTNTTHDENATHWRDLADQLTREQIAALEREGREGANSPYTPGSLRFEARQYAIGNMGTALLGPVAPPVDAIRVYEWETGYTEDGAWSRTFDGADHKIGDATLRVWGVQYGDGTTKREINVVADDLVDAAGARRLAAALIEAADELDRLTSDS
jgi:hypothetical protein